MDVFRDGNNFDLVGGLFKVFGPPFLIICIAIAAFSYFITTGKKRTGIILGVTFILVAVAWFASNFINR